MTQSVVPPHPIYNLTPFQMQFCEHVESDQEFANWVPICVRDDEKPRAQGPLCLMWYTEDGRLHAARLGRDSVIAAVMV